MVYESSIVNIKGKHMKLISQIIILCCFISLANTKLFAKSMTVLDFEHTPFIGKVSQKEIRKLLLKGGIRATLAVPTYVSIFVNGTLMSGIAPKGTQVVFVPNDDNDYYTMLPIVGGGNVSIRQKMEDYPTTPHIQLVWYLLNNEHDAIYTLISLPE